MAERMIVVRFVADCGFYARGEEAAFPETQAMGLVSKGVAIVLGPADEIAAPKRTMSGQLARQNSIAAALTESDDATKRQGARV